MTEAPTTEAPLRFQRTARGAALLAHPLASRLEETLTAKQRKEHAALVERVEQAAQEIARLRAAIDQAPGADRQAGREAALRGEDVPPPSEPTLRAELEEAQRQRQVLEAALRESADGLLQAAAPKADEIASALEQEENEMVEEVRARLAAVGEAVRELADLTGQAAWVRWLVDASGQTASPYRSSSGDFGETLGAVSNVEAALSFELDALAARRRDRVEELRVAAAAEQERRAATAGGEEGR